MVNRTTISINQNEITSIRNVLEGTETLSGFVHWAIKETVRKRCVRNERRAFAD
jgi:hypothetical protein